MTSRSLTRQPSVPAVQQGRAPAISGSASQTVRLTPRNSVSHRQTPTELFVTSLMLARYRVARRKKDPKVRQLWDFAIDRLMQANAFSPRTNRLGVSGNSVPWKSLPAGLEATRQLTSKFSIFSFLRVHPAVFSDMQLPNLMHFGY